MAKRKNNTLSNLGKTTKEDVSKILPENEVKLTGNTKPKVTRAKNKDIEKITIIEPKEQNLPVSDDTIQEAVIVEENSAAVNIVIDDMIDAVKDVSTAQEVKEKKSQYKHPLLEAEGEKVNPYEMLTHLYATLIQDMAKFQHELFSVSWKLFIENSNTMIGQYYGILNSLSRVKK